MKIELTKKELLEAVEQYVKKTYKKVFNIENLHFSNGERYVPVKFIEVIVKDNQKKED